MLEPHVYGADGNSNLVIPVRMHHSERSGSEAESVTRANNQRSAFRQRKQAVASTASSTSVYQRLYQVCQQLLPVLQTTDAAQC